MSTPVRTNSDAVIGILQADYDFVKSTPLTPYIETASSIIDWMLWCARQKRIPIGALNPELSERWLAAHMYVMMDQTYQMRSTLRASGQFQGQTGMMLMASKYGQMAIATDISGCLNNVDKQSRVRAFWGGRPFCAQTPWWLRGRGCCPFPPNLNCVPGPFPQ